MLVECKNILRHFQIAGTSLEPFDTTSTGKLLEGTRLITVANSKNQKDWTIRSQAPKSVMIRIRGRFND